MLAKVVSHFPPTWIRFAGSLQFKLPVVGPLIGLIGRKVLATEGVIKYGVGAGLRFDARGGFAGYLLGTSEPLEQEALARYLKRGMVFYDIGANIGFYSTIAARIVGVEGWVYAFEPNPVCAASIRRNAALNGFANVEVIEAAVGERAGRATLTHGTCDANTVLTSDDAGNFPMLSIDECDLRPPDVVMIDVEGAEVGAIRGMMRTIKEHRPVIMCEVHWLVGEFDEARKEIEREGYECRTLDGEPFPVTPKHYHALFVPTDSEPKNLY